MRDHERDEAAATLALEKIDGSLVRASEGTDPPGDQPMLYHYTSSEGLRGIIEGNCLRFSDPLYLNDGSEVHYANSLLDEAVEQLCNGKSGRTARFARLVANQIKTAAIEYRPIIFCLSEAPDLLNQWRDYGRDIVPYSIEFSRDGLLRQDWSFPCDLIRMNYNEDQQRTVLAKLLEDVSEALETNRRALFNRQYGPAVLNAALSEIWGALITFKNPAFAAEREWRLVAYTSMLGNQRPSHRTSTLGVIPYFSRYPRSGYRLPIGTVWVGPSPWSEVTQRASRGFLMQHGYDVPIVPSQIPART